MTAVVERSSTKPAPSDPSASAAPARVRIAEPALHHIVIVGGGAADLELATKLGACLGRRKKAEITLVERSRTHVWKPLLHEVAAGSLDVGRDAVDYLAQAAEHHFRYRIGEMIGLDRARHEMHLAASVDPEGTKSRPRARSRTIRSSSPWAAPATILAHSGLRTSRSRSIPRSKPSGSTSGSSTGSSGLMHSPDRYDRGSCMSRSSARARPEPSWRPSFIARPAKSSPTASTASIPRRTSRSRWSKPPSASFPRIKGPDVLRDLDGLEASRSNQLVVTPTLQTTRDPDVFAMGDCAFLINPGETKPVPPRAHAAHQQASHLVKQMNRRPDGKPLQWQPDGVCDRQRPPD